MINIVMLVKDRPALTRQALTTLAANTDVDWNLTIVDDQSKPETRDLLRLWSSHYPNVALLRNEKSAGITGQVRNLGVYWSERYFGRGDWLCLADNDVAFFPKWASRIEHAAKLALLAKISLVGGARHPYHGVNETLGEIEVTDAVAGYLQLMRWQLWHRYGPLDAREVGVGRSEDYVFCRKIVEAGGKVGYINPPVIAHTGITNSLGEPATGHEAIERVPGVLYQ